MKCIKINPTDNVAVALSPIAAGEELCRGVMAVQNISQGHKAALCNLAVGMPVIKYGYPIGITSCAVQAGEHLHVHNMRTCLDKQSYYSYNPVQYTMPKALDKEFDGYLRDNGTAAVRNEVWVIPTVGCVNGVCRKLAASAHAARPQNVDGVYAYEHPFGCSQMGDDHEQTRKLLAALSCNPNAGAALFVGLGCENNHLQGMKEALGAFSPDCTRFMECQSVDDEFAVGTQLLGELMTYCNRFTRQPLPLSKLVVGLKCGGSDGLSGITANPAAGTFSDLLIACGGSTILTEVPEMFGAEQVLLGRCTTSAVYDKAVAMLTNFKQYFVAHNQVVYENPSPGNKQGGITTLEDKSLGCVQKGGKAPVTGVLGYGEQISTTGLNLLCAPGNDLVSTTALTAAGAQIILFTTGRGTPFGSPVPTAKLSTNSQLATAKPHWIDWNAGSIVADEDVEQAGARLLNYVIELASGRVTTKAEQRGYREIAIWKGGVVL